MFQDAGTYFSTQVVFMYRMKSLISDNSISPFFSTSSSSSYGRPNFTSSTWINLWQNIEWPVWTTNPRNFILRPTFCKKPSTNRLLEMKVASHKISCATSFRRAKICMLESKTIQNQKSLSSGPLWTRCSNMRFELQDNSPILFCYPQECRKQVHMCHVIKDKT